jgi:hypothetical protein
MRRTDHSTWWSSWVLAAIAFLVCGRATAGPGRWTSGGPFGGEVTTLALDPTIPGLSYAGRDRDVFRSLDAGDTWARATSSAPGRWGKRERPARTFAPEAQPTDGRPPRAPACSARRTPRPVRAIAARDATSKRSLGPAPPRTSRCGTAEEERWWPDGPSRKFSLKMEAVEEGAEVLTYQN